MTQFKDKSATLLTAENGDVFVAESGEPLAVDTKNVNSVTLGLFNYPVLMAADILLYGAQYVPVGDDQSQHLEFTRNIAERMNNKFGELFVVPEPVKKQHEFFGKDQGLRIKDLQDPSRKMSKSEESDKGVIFLGDSPDEAAKKVMSAATDSIGAVHYDTENQPGVTNLLQIHALLSDRTPQEVIQKHEGQTSYGEFKGKVAEQVKDFLIDFQAKLASVDEAALMAKLQADEAKMNAKASETLLKVQKAVGLR
jgi:tryptophanyl-tRNA synthetase